MAEANSTPLSEAELEQVRSILQPLSKNPDISEELNPMLSVFRQKMGYGTQMSSHDDEEIEEETETTEESISDFEEEGEEESTSPKRPPTKVFEDDDIDLDELLAEPGQAPESPPATDDFSFEEETPNTDSVDPFTDLGMDSDDSLDVPEIPPTSSSDDFSLKKKQLQTHPIRLRV